MIKEFSQSTKKGYKYFQTTCSLSISGTQAKVIINEPTLHPFINNLIYEIAITENYA